MIVNIAPFYGCHNIRPSELHNEAKKTKESAYRPTSLDDLIIACGGKTVDYEEKNKMMLTYWLFCTVS